MIPLLLTIFPPPQELCDTKEGHSWESAAGGFISKLVAGPGKWIPIGFIAIIMGLSVHYTGITDGDSDDLMPGVEKGINLRPRCIQG